ncbi:MAG TPA: helix-turn-helix domain-containing protein [Pseudonocardia sp.]|jgi:transcriptional regulator GlxA family with amidase domain|nr:helix-turn-helix domain-containing protein [Pseudonocardia sp.]
MHSLAIAVTDGIPLFELAVPCAVFGLEPLAGAHPVDSWYDVRVCAAPGARVGGWLVADPPFGLDALAAADTVIVPACHDIERPPPAELLAALRAAHDRGARIASICTGAFTLAAAGLLDGRRATTHWMHAARLAELYPAIDVDASVLYLEDTGVLTSAGKAAGIDLCLHLVRHDHGATVANELARRMVVAPHRAGGQAQFIAAAVAPDESHSLSDLLAWALERLDQPLTVGDLATRAHLSTRQLTRQFVSTAGTTPLQWLLTQRIHRAREFLEHTDDSVDRIAAQVGMGTAATLRRHFNRVVGVAPDGYRRAFRTARSR